MVRGPRSGSGPKVAIVGGSLGGLMAALELVAIGCDVHVFERSPAPLEGAGAGIVLHPETARVLVTKANVDLDRISSWTRILRYLQDDGQAPSEEPIAYRFTSYAALYAGLVAALDPGRYHLGSTFVGLDPSSDGINLRFADGRIEHTDVVVGADGIRSTLRRMFLPNIRTQYAGYVAWRGTLAGSALSARTADRLNGVLTYHLGPASHILSYEIPGEGSEQREMNWVWYRDVAAGEALGDLLTDRDGGAHELSLASGLVQERHVEAMQRVADRELPRAFAEAVVSCPDPFVQVIVDLAVPAMAFGRVCILGDAAFALRPHVAAGTAKAAADARALALALLRSEMDVDRAIATWERGQLQLGRRASDRARDLGERLRNGAVRPGDREPAFGLREPGDHDFADIPETTVQGEGGSGSVPR